MVYLNKSIWVVINISRVFNQEVFSVWNENLNSRYLIKWKITYLLKCSFWLRKSSGSSKNQVYDKYQNRYVSLFSPIRCRTISWIISIYHKFKWIFQILTNNWYCSCTWSKPNQTKIRHLFLLHKNKISPC
jgi:hypothetical protein